MKFALLVCAHPGHQQGAATALRFARASLQAGHSIERVFFFRDGVQAANELVVLPQDDLHVPRAWQAFCAEHAIDAVACVSAALRRGLVDAREAQRQQLPASNLAAPMVIGGLGQLADMLASADRLVTFG